MWIAGTIFVPTIAYALGKAFPAIGTDDAAGGAGGKTKDGKIIPGWQIDNLEQWDRRAVERELARRNRRRRKREA